MNYLKEHTKYALAILLLVVFVAFIASVFSGNSEQEEATGSFSQGVAMNATSTSSTSAGTHWLAKSTENTSACVVGSVIVASSSATDFTLWNATSTTDTASTTIATLPANVDAGTYEFNAVCTRGLVVDTPAGFDGWYVVTWQ